ncbi:MAG TPA: hypothetical protein VIV06_00205, partial [Candidatus Limnocylindrales bacterium]
MTGQPILSDATLEAMLARRAGAGVPSGLAEAIDSALGRLPERRSWQSFLAPPARWTSAMGLVWVLAMLALLMAVSLSAFLVASDLLRRADEPTVVPPPTVQPAPSTTPPSVSPSAGPPAAATRPIDQFNSLAFAADGSVWLATTGGLIHWDLHTPTATLYGQNEGLPTTAALNVKVAPDGTVWAVGGTSFRVWFAQYDGRWTVYSTPADLGGVEIIDFGGMAVGADGRVWSAVSSSVGPNGLLRFDGTWTAIDVPESVGVNASPWGFGLTVAPDGTLWAGTPFSGLAAFDGTTWTSYSAATTGLPRTPWLAGVAPDGSVWVGLPGEGCTVSTGCAVPAAGVARFDGTSWSVYTTADGLADDDANVFVGPGRDVWITYATLPDTVSRFDGGRWNTMQVAGLAGATALAVAPDGALWLHATDGLLRYDGSALTRYQLPAVEVPPELPPLELPLISGPTETRSGLGTIVWRTYRSPSEYYLRASSTPHGPVAIDGPDLRWLIAAGSWAGTTLPIAPWRATAAGDDV